MFLRILGSVDVSVDGQWRRAGPAKQAAILAALAMTPNRSVPQSALVLRAWGADPPSSSRSALYSYVARLRRLLAPVPGAAIDRGVGGGYRLDISEDSVDLFVMRGLAEDAARLHDSGDIDAAIDHWRRAVGLWRDRPLAHIETAWADRVRSALTREHVSHLQRLYSAELDAGGHNAVIAELTEAVLAHPQEEGLVAELMRAMFLSGRQSDALGLYSETASRLRREYGLEPGPVLRQMHRKILRHDPTLQPKTGAATGLPSTQQIPSAPRLVGRSEEMRRLDELFAAGRDGAVELVLITGEAGLGKTTLALNWAHCVADEFPDGQLFGDLRGGQPAVSGADVLTGLLSSLGVPGRSVPTEFNDRVALYRSRTANRRLLVVLDNVVDPADVRALTPTGAGSLVLVTSRQSLSGLVALQDAHRVSLDPMPTDEAMRLLTALMGAGRVSAEPEAAEALVELCAGSPLALRIAAADVAQGDAIGDYVAAMRPPEPVTADTVTPAVIDHAFERLDPRAQLVFRCCGAAPGPTAAPGGVAAMAGLSAADTTSTLDVLQSRGWITTTPSGDVEVHSALKERLVDHDDGTTDRMHRLFDWCIHSARFAAEVISSGGLQLAAPPRAADLELPQLTTTEQAMAWFRSQEQNLTAVIHRAAAAGHPAAWLLIDGMRLYLERSTQLPMRTELLELGVEAAEAAGDRVATVVLRTALARRIKVQGDPATAEGLWVAALADAETDELRSTIELDLAELYYRAGRLDEARERSESALSIPDPSDRQRMIGMNVLASIQRERGRVADSRRMLEELVDSLEGPKLTPALWNLAVTCREMGDLIPATGYAERALRYAVMHHASQSYVLDVLARIHIERGNVAEARARAIESYEHIHGRAAELYVPRAMVTLAWCTGDAEEARALATMAARYARQTSLAQVETDAHLVNAHARLATGRTAEAMVSAAESLRLSAHYGYRALSARSHFIRGRIHREMGDLERALRDVSTAEAEFTACGDRVGLARATHLRAVMTGDTELAEESNQTLTECGAARVRTPEEDR